MTERDDPMVRARRDSGFRAGLANMLLRRFWARPDPAVLAACLRLAPYWEAEEDHGAVNGLIQTVAHFTHARATDMAAADITALSHGPLAATYFFHLRGALRPHRPTIPDPGDSRRVAITLPFLGPPNNSIMTLARRFGRLLASEMGRQVRVFDVASLPTPWESLPFSAYRANIERGASEHPIPWPALGGLETVSFAGGVRSPARIARTVAAIADFRPAAVLALGDWSWVPDLVADRLPVALLPLSATRVPATAAPVVLDPEGRLPAAGPVEGLAPDLVPTLCPYQPLFDDEPASAPLDRQRLGLPEDAVVLVVVGTRLAREMGPAFEQALVGILSQAPRAHVLFLGLTEPRWEHAALKGPLAARLHYRGATPVRQVFPACDIFLNPFREGGGTSGAEAVLDGLAVVTLDWGDVATIIGPSRGCADQETYVRQAVTLCRDGEALAAAQAASRTSIRPAILDRRRIADQLQAAFHEARRHLAAGWPGIHAVPHPTG